MILVLLLAITAFLIYYKCIKPMTYWKDRGVPQTNPWPIVGDSLPTLLGTKNTFDLFNGIYNSTPESRYLGIYQMAMPALLIRDPDLIKQITVKDFDHFLNRQQFVEPEAEILFSKNLFLLKDNAWREMRTTLSPSFTSSKMRMMYGLMETSAKHLVDHFKEKNEEIIEVKMKDVFSRYANDVIASTAFGVNLNSLEDRNNHFYLIGKQISDFRGFWLILKVGLYFVVPKIYKYFKIGVFDKEVYNYFSNLIKDNIKQREEHGIVRPDMIQILLEAKNGKPIQESKTVDVDTGFATVEEHQHSNAGKSKHKVQITDEDIIAQAVIFLFAGFETSSSLMSFLAYELAVHPDIQKRLADEVLSTLAETDGNVSYEALLKMKYLDMVVSETLRKWPITLMLSRVCTKPFTIEPKAKDEVAVHLKVGDTVFIPMAAIQHDPKYYPNPEKFDPERFSEENVKHLNPYTYMTFGLGPRNCIGSRFALLETKLIIFNILAHFEIVPIEETRIPLQLDNRSFFLSDVNGVPLGLRPLKRK